VKSRNYNNQGGFIALMSVIIIFAALIILVSIVSTTGFYTRFSVLDYENKKVSVGLAEACVETALVNLAKDPANYPASIPAAGQQIAIETGRTCRICSVSASSPYTIVTRASYNKAYTNLSVNTSAGASNYTINSWDEQRVYAGSCTLP
jgi:hypothetical protein